MFLSACVKITDKGVKYLGNVHTLSLYYCNLITDEGIKYLGNVIDLDIRGCMVTKSGIDKYLVGVKLRFHRTGVDICD